MTFAYFDLFSRKSSIVYAQLCSKYTFGNIRQTEFQRKIET